MERLAGIYQPSSGEPTLILLNLVDFDMLWGHRNDPEGMKRGLVEFDRWLGPFAESLGPGDLLLMTADHGNDPTTPSTDHSREEVPLLALPGGSDGGADLGVREGFMDVAATLADYFGVPAPRKGTSLWPAIRKGIPS
jgi:phosphopentomutase